MATQKFRTTTVLDAEQRRDIVEAARLDDRTVSSYIALNMHRLARERIALHRAALDGTNPFAALVALDERPAGR